MTSLRVCLLETPEISIKHLMHLDTGVFIHYAISFPKTEGFYVYKISPYISKKIETAYRRHKSIGKKAVAIKKNAQGEPFKVKSL